jgi:hypothetical protein
MLTMLRRALTVATLSAAAAGWGAVPASASGLPELLVNSKCGSSGQCSGVYKVRPQKIELAEAYGGEVTIATWSAWTGSSATGTGTAVSSGMGNTTTLQVTVTASDVKHGKFTHLTLTTTGSSGSPDVEHLHLTKGTLPDWIS